jgi:hypothetical protein
MARNTDRRPKAGRPKAIIDWEKVDKMLQAHCDGAGIAGLLGIHPDTLYNACKEEKKIDFSAYKQQKMYEGVELLRQKQFGVAMQGDKSMLIWLGKQYAGQRDKNQTEITGVDGAPLQMIVEFGDDGK